MKTEYNEKNNNIAETIRTMKYIDTEIYFPTFKSSDATKTKEKRA